MRLPPGHDRLKMLVFGGALLCGGAVKFGLLGENFSLAHTPEPPSATTPLDTQVLLPEAHGPVLPK